MVMTYLYYIDDSCAPSMCKTIPFYRFLFPFTCYHLYYIRKIPLFSLPLYLVLGLLV